jgi:arginyl-tRNA synthetase
MNIFAEFEVAVIEAAKALTAKGVLSKDIELTGISVEPPRDPAHGDLATNAAMALSKRAKMKPRDLATALATELEAHPRIVSVEIAGPGFINLRLDPAAWLELITAALKAGSDYGRSTVGAGKSVNVEFVSANPTGPLHVGHTRGAVVGDALAGLYDFAGWNVTREYYINDGGAQVDVLARSAFLRYQEALGSEIEIPDGLYPGDYLKPVGEALKEKFGDTLLNMPEEEWLPLVREIATEAMMETIRADLGALGVKMDVYFSEKSLYDTGLIEAAIASLENEGLIFQGVLEPPKGKKVEDWEPREQTLFKSTAYGDDVDRPIKKSDGGWTYFAPDIAYHYNKITRGYDLLVDVFGADHGGYIKRMKAAVAALSQNKVELDINICQLVNILKDGQPFKMSKRAGSFITLRDVLDEVGPDATRLTMLMRKNEAPFDFDFAKALEQSKDNPVWYVQYAHARHASAIREGAKKFGADAVTDEALIAADMSLLSHPSQQALLRKLAEWPRLVEQAARACEPHRIAFFLHDIASAFNGHYQEGYADPSLRFIQENDPEGSVARLALARMAGLVLANGLGVLGVAPLNEMR